jgi:phage tail sheath protein FI
MPEYLSPGVYVEEVDAGPKPIEGVSTSTAGAVGVTARGPDEGKPVLVTSFADFQRKFGGSFEVPDSKKTDFASDPEGGEFWNFPLSVKGFFDNGGQRLYIKRVVSENASPSSAQLECGVVSVVRSDAPAGSRMLQLEHLIGIEPATYELVIAGTVTAIKVLAYDATARSIELDQPLPDRVRAGRDYVIAVKGSSPATKKVTLAASAKGKWGDGIAVQVGAMVAATLNLVALDTEKEVRGEIAKDSQDPAKFELKVTTGVIGDLKKDDWVVLGGERYQLAADAAAGPPAVLELVVPATWRAGAIVKRVKVNASDPPFEAEIDVDSTNGTKFKLKAPTVGQFVDLKKDVKVTVDGRSYEIAVDTAAADVEVKPVNRWAKGIGVARLRKASDPANAKIIVWGASALYPGAVVELDNGTKKLATTISTVDGNKVTLGANTIAMVEGDKLRLVEVSVRAAYGSGAGAIDELFPGLRVHDDPNDRASDYLPTRLQSAALVRVDASTGSVDITALADFPLGKGPNLAPGWQALTGGDDDLAAIDADAFIGVDAGPGKRTGITALEDIDEISICMVPGIWAPSVHSALITHCEILKDRFAIIDPPRESDDVEEIRTFREVIDTKYAAIYWPWIAVRDPGPGRTVEIGPSAHIAGIYARTDVERGVHKAPANEVIRGIDLGNGKHGLRVEITRREQDMLNPKGINALRFFPNRGTRVWGARTLSSDGSWKYINVRRIFIYVEESIDEGTQWVVFEPNDEPTWARVRASITNFLTTVWRGGALQGAKAEEAFFVRCDRTTMSQDDIDNGRLICVIGIAPVKPAEFVIFRIQQKTLETQAQA